ncbi:hypothetical protein [Streptomyces sp. NPDC048111]|uniref:hypothetical protein n=1 Tax=Streptomyces sp. NPDC048111 TaxID=3365500 RepID=UPI00372306DB
MAPVTDNGASFPEAFDEAFRGSDVNEALRGSDVVGGPSLVPQRPAATPSAKALADRQLLRLVECLIGEAPSDCRQITAVFALTLRSGTSRVQHTNRDGSTEATASADAMRLARELRRTTARLPRGPWWRLTLDLPVDPAVDLHTGDDIDVTFDYGDEPFPEEHTFAPGDYRADLEAFGRSAERLPTWLSAHVSHDGRQLRSPRRAAAPAGPDSRDAARSLSPKDLPDLTRTWARWAVVAAGFVAIGSSWGPRMQPSRARFEGAKRGGSTLWLLAGDRAVLSGGVWNAPGLAEAYRGDAPHPELFAGAPAWVADPLLDARNNDGLLSFCYWWESGRWLRGESPKTDEIATAIPGVWTTDTVAGILADLTQDGSPDTEAAVLRLVTAAEEGFAERALLAEVFGDGPDTDLDGAYHQLVMAGVTRRTDLPRLPRHQAIASVSRYMLAHGLDSPDYRAADLVADRVDCGWMVFVPVPDGEIRIGRGLFFVADDEVLELTDTQSANPSRYAEQFARRYRDRWGL